jgi:predicted nuclease of predicted toxin-antitoxin system
VTKLREVSAVTATDEDVLRLAAEKDCLLITCNRDDFLNAAATIQHLGIIIMVRRRSRALERAALIRLLDTAGETGLCRNINFA